MAHAATLTVPSCVRPVQFSIPGERVVRGFHEPMARRAVFLLDMALRAIRRVHIGLLTMEFEPGRG